MFALEMTLSVRRMYHIQEFTSSTTMNQFHINHCPCFLFCLIVKCVTTANSIKVQNKNNGIDIIKNTIIEVTKSADCKLFTMPGFPLLFRIHWKKLRDSTFLFHHMLSTVYNFYNPTMLNNSYTAS